MFTEHHFTQCKWHAHFNVTLKTFDVTRVHTTQNFTLNWRWRCFDKNIKSSLGRGGWEWRTLLFFYWQLLLKGKHDIHNRTGILCHFVFEIWRHYANSECLWLLFFAFDWLGYADRKDTTREDDCAWSAGHSKTKHTDPVNAADMLSSLIFRSEQISDRWVGLELCRCWHLASAS